MTTQERFIFLSYSRRDAAAADELRALLIEAGELVYQDVVTMRLGGSWLKQIGEAIAQCTAFVVLIGDEGINRWVAAEVDVALRRHYSPRDANAFRLPIYPVLLPKTKSDAVPSLLRNFPTLPWAPGAPLPTAFRHALQSLTPLPAHPTGLHTCPYPGLSPFNAENAQYFFGRQVETRNALEALGSSGFDPESTKDDGAHPTYSGTSFCKWLQVEGNSGSGKSSLVVAGLLPLIAGGALWVRTGLPKWKILGPIVPGRDPLTRLAEALETGLKPDAASRDIGQCLARLNSNQRSLAFAIREIRERGTGYLLIVDQFEELFTVSDPTSRRAFDALLSCAIEDPDCPLFLINTVRADFLDQYEDLPRLAGITNERCHRFLLGPISPAGLREAIELPAHLAGIDVREVSHAILHEARDEPGALPLVANALRQIWNPAHPERLEVAELNARGGIAGLLSAGADNVLERIEREIPNGRNAALELLLSLTRFSADGRHTRQRISRAEAIQAAGNGKHALGERVLNALAGARDSASPEDAQRHNLRLVATGMEGGKPYVELVHETLVRARHPMATREEQSPYWPSLYNFIWANRRRGLIRQELAIQVERWKAHGFLTRWQQLAGPMELLRYRRLRLARDSEERRFLAQSRGVVTILAALVLAIGALFVESAWWVASNRLPLTYVFIQPLWRLGWTPRPELQEIKGGEASVGCAEVRSGPSGEQCIGPGRRLKVDDFSIGKYSVTFLEYDRYVWATSEKRRAPDLYPRDEGHGRWDHPVINVSWEDASKYINWLRSITGDPTYRLPTDVEWEYAARAAGTGRFPWGDESPIASKLANCASCASDYANRSTSPVGEFRANAFGLYDMVGNVWQWMADVPTADQKNIRFIRGGSWNNPIENLQIWRRGTAVPDRRNGFIGFRVARGPAVQSAGLVGVAPDAPMRWGSEGLTPAQVRALADLRYRVDICPTVGQRCETWSFVGRGGNATAPDGTESALIVRAFDEQAITVDLLRPSQSGPRRQATFRVARSGSVVRIRELGDRDQESSTAAERVGRLAPVEAPIPTVIRSCVTPGYTHCWTYRWEGSGYVATGEGGLTATLSARVKLLEYSPKRISTWVEQPRGYWAYAGGQVSSAGSRVMDGSFIDSNGTRGGLMFVWADALEEMPTSSMSANRADAGGQVTCYGWVTGVVC